ncbi:MAG: hypothetical protein LBS59_06925 [Puniceicoccales bacterium]|jgi:hypothetical protein|nr:hypothetical protein [Puniceicoccales bacterium]
MFQVKSLFSNQQRKCANSTIVRLASFVSGFFLRLCALFLTVAFCSCHQRSDYEGISRGMAKQEVQRKIGEPVEKFTDEIFIRLNQGELWVYGEESTPSDMRWGGPYKGDFVVRFDTTGVVSWAGIWK